MASDVEHPPQPGVPGHRKLLSARRLKLHLTAFVGVLILLLFGLTFLLVTKIFGRITPSMQSDLEWKAKHGATELAQAVAIRLAASDREGIERIFSQFSGASGDVLALVALDRGGATVAAQGRVPDPAAALFDQPPGEVRAGPGFLTAWARASVEEEPLGRVAVVISTKSLEAGHALRRLILLAGTLGCGLALGVSLVFVNIYLVPVITLTQQGLRIAREMELATRIQTSLLPKVLETETLTVAATMVPTADVGGDYYDVIPTDEGCWIGIGDVAGHGIQAGLVMMMIQSVVSALVKRFPGEGPRGILTTLNEVLQDNIRDRMQSDEHVTFTLLRYFPDGRIQFAGAHEELLILRRATGRCERIPTSGPWLGAVKNVGQTLVDELIQLDPGDLLILYTDGVIEAINDAGERFGIDRLCAAIEGEGDTGVADVHRRVMRALRRFMAYQEDDVTLLVCGHTIG